MSTRLHAGLTIDRSDPTAHADAEPVMFGFWIFLMSDLVVVALLFATYAAMSAQGIAGGPRPRDVVDLTTAAMETAVLLTSSFTFGLASLAIKHERYRPRLGLWLWITAALGAAFLALEARDFLTLAEKGAIPQLSGFLSAYWTLLATHGLHVLAALAWLAVIGAQLRRFGLRNGSRLRLMRLALFWHMLDIVWVGIFTFVFLAGARA